MVEKNKNLSNASMAVLRTVRILEAQAKASPYLLDMYCDPKFPIAKIAEIVFPATHLQYPQATIAAITNATKELVSSVERERLKRKRLSQRMIEANKRLSPSDYSEQQRKAAKVRGKFGFIGQDKAITSRGRTAWTDEEKLYAQRLATNESFLHTHGVQKGNPDYVRISVEINKKFHNGESIRNAGSLNAHFADIRRRRI